MENFREKQRDVFAKVVEGGPSMKVTRKPGTQQVTYWDVVMLDSPEGKAKMRQWADIGDGEQRFDVR